MPEMEARVPSIFEVTSCSTTRAEAPGQLNQTVIPFWLTPGAYCTWSSGIMAIPITIRVAITRITVKGDMRRVGVLMTGERGAVYRSGGR